MNLKREFRFDVRKFLFVFILSFSFSAVAQDNPDALPGWVRGTSVGSDGKEIQGITLNGQAVLYSSPVIADVDGNPGNGLETVTGTSDGIISVHRADGLLLWTAELPNHSCNKAGDTNKLLASPAVGDIFGNGVPHVVAGYGGVPNRSCEGGVIALRGTDGQVAWNFSTNKNAKKFKYGVPVGYAVVSAPALADTDGDGKMEIGFGSFDRNVYLLNADGSLRWFYNAADTIWGSAAFANVDRDPKLEMIMGTDISANKRLKPVTKNGGFVYAFKTESRNNKRISFRDKSAYVWQSYLPQVMYTSPVVADVLPSAGDEIIVLSGCFFPQGSNNKDGKWIKILKGSTGKVIQTLPINACSSSQAAVGDIDDDGKLEIVATVNGAKNIGGDGSSRIVAFNPEDTTPIWSIIPYDKGRNDEYGGNFMSPVIADVDGNGSLEVLAGNGESVSIFNGRDGAALTCQTRGCGDKPFILETGGTLHSTPAIADVNLDGVLDIIAASNDKTSNKGGLFGWTNMQDFITSPAGNQSPNSAPWPMYRGNANHTAKK